MLDQDSMAHRLEMNKRCKIGVVCVNDKMPREYMTEKSKAETKTTKEKYGLFQFFNGFGLTSFHFSPIFGTRLSVDVSEGGYRIFAFLSKQGAVTRTLFSFFYNSFLNLIISKHNSHKQKLNANPEVFGVKEGSLGIEMLIVFFAVPIFNSHSIFYIGGTHD